MRQDFLQAGCDPVPFLGAEKQVHLQLPFRCWIRGDVQHCAFVSAKGLLAARSTALDSVCRVCILCRTWWRCDNGRNYILHFETVSPLLLRLFGTMHCHNTAWSDDSPECETAAVLRWRM